jgi:hypothetical protein
MKNFANCVDGLAGGWYTLVCSWTGVVPMSKSSSGSGFVLDLVRARDLEREMLLSL